MAWPDYMTRETLANRLDLKPGAVDQYVRRGLLPQPIHIGEAVRWRWTEVDSWLRGVKEDAVSTNDPFMAGLTNGAQKRGPVTAPRQ